MMRDETAAIPEEAEIRQALSSDVLRISSIYGDAIENTTSTSAPFPRTEAQMHEWYNAHGERHPLYVVEHNQEAVGWGALSLRSLRESDWDTVCV